MLSEELATLINPAAEQVDGRMELALRRICETLSLDRAAVIQVSPAADRVTCSHSWAAAGIDPYPCQSMEELPWNANGLKSNAVFPLSAGGQVIGALAFGMVQEEREWPAAVMARFGLAAENIRQCDCPPTRQ